MLMTFLNGVFLLKTILQGSPGETMEEEKGNGGKELSCPSWTTQEELDGMAGDIYDIIRDIQDPEKPNTLEELEVVYEDGVTVSALETEEQGHLIHIEFTPTVPHCSLATLIGLCLRVRLERTLPSKHKLDIIVKKGTHATEDEINKQINDKERIAAAMENPNLRKLVEKCVEIGDY